MAEINIFSPDHCIIIAEAGVNHNGSLAMAKQLVRAAAAAGADYVKFQTFSADALVTRRARQAAYQQRNLGSSPEDSQYDMLKKLELSREMHYELLEECKKCSIRFLSSAFDTDSLLFLARDMNVDFIKIPSGELTNYPFLRCAAACGKPVILSTGMGTLEEIREAFQLLIASGVPKNEICVLHCTTEYPAPFHTVNLNVIKRIEAMLGCAAGYSDHTRGIEVSIAAVALGARVIEKHFTLDKTLPGPDHPASLEPEELKELVTAVRNVSVALGTGEKVILPQERENRTIVRRSIVAARKIAAGEVFSEHNLTVKRPAGGLSPMAWPQVIGRIAKHDFNEDDLIEL